MAHPDNLLSECAILHKLIFPLQVEEDAVLLATDVVGGSRSLHDEILKVEGFALDEEMADEGVANTKFAVTACLHNKGVVASATEQTFTVRLPVDTYHIVQTDGVGRKAVGEDGVAFDSARTHFQRVTESSPIDITCKLAEDIERAAAQGALVGHITKQTLEGRRTHRLMCTRDYAGIKQLKVVRSPELTTQHLLYLPAQRVYILVFVYHIPL